jgi:hypothetical protein
MRKSDEALRFLHFSINQFRQPPEGRTRETGQSLARKLEEPRYWDSPDALNLMDLRPAKSEERSGPDNLRVLLQKLAPDWILDEAGKERKKLDRKKDSRYMSGTATHVYQPLSPT